MGKESKASESVSTERIKKAIDKWYSYYGDNIKNYENDTQFVHGEQWTDIEKDEHKRLKKPTFTMNKVYPYVKQLIGEQRQNTPALEVRAMEENVPQNDVDVRSGMIRYIAYNSKSDVVYQTAFGCGLKGGFGAFRITTDYENHDSFNLVIKYEKIQDPLTCFWDVNANDPNKEDGTFCGIYKTVDKEYFQALYPDVDVATLHDNALTTPFASPYFSWMPDKDSINIVEFYEKQFFTKKLLLLSNGETIEESDFDEYKKGYKLKNETSGVFMPQLEVEKTREAEDYKIMCYKVSGDEVLEETEWPSRSLPILFVPGDIAYFENKENTISFVRYAKDAQKFLNYLKTDMAFAIMTSHTSLFLGSPENIPDNEAALRAWQNPAVKQGILIANPDRFGNLPTKLPPNELSQSESQQYHVAEQDIQSILGMYEAVKGMQGNEISGVAVANKVRQGNLTNFVYYDNLNRAIEHAGRVVLEMLPRVYDSDRVVGVTDKIGNGGVARINNEVDGKVQNDLSKGNYQVEIRAGASFGMQKQEQFANVMQLVQAVPGYGQVTVDKLAALLDVENTSEFVERAKTMLPPAIQAKESGNEQKYQQEQENQQQMQQEMLKLQQEKVKADIMDAHADQTTAEAKMIEAVQKTHGNNHELQTAQVKSQAEIGKAILDYKQEMAKLQANDSMIRLQEENEALKHLVSQVM